MTVPTTVNSVTYAGPQAMPLAIPFKFFKDADLQVAFTSVLGVVTTLVLNTDYTLTGAQQPSGGTLTLLAGDMVLNQSITILRAPAAVQDVSLPNGSRYFGSVIEAALDLLTMLVQDAKGANDRAVLFPLGESGFDQDLPAKLDRINQIAGWDADGNFTPLATASVYGTTNFIVDEFDAGSDFTPGVTSSLTLSQDPGTPNNLDIYFDAGYQQKSSYTLVGAVVTFDAPIPLGVLKVECLQAQVLPVGSLGANTVSAAALQTGAVTTNKLADDAVTTPKLADASVTLAKLAADALQGGKNAIVNGGAAVANGADYAASVSGTYGYGKSELCKGALVGTAVAGTLTRVTNSSVGRTGLAFRWSAVTTTGAGIAKFRFFIESKDAVNYKNQTCSLSALVRHDTGASVNFAIVVSKANAADDFSAVTLISTGPTIAVASATNGTIYNRAVAMGDCTNGVMVEITAAIGAVTGKLVDLTQVQFELGSVETDYSFEPIAVTVDKVLRYFEKLTEPYAHISVGQCYDTSHANFPIRYARKRKSPCVVTVINGANWIMTNGDGTSRSLSGIGTPVNGGEIGCELTATAAAATLLAGDSSLLLTNSAGEYITIDGRF